MKDFHPLSPSENEIIKNCANGETWKGHPDRTKSPPIRAKLIRFLALGGDILTPISEYGISIVNANITGLLDLSGGIIQSRLIFKDCAFPEGIDLNDAQTSAIELTRCEISSLCGRRSTISGSLKMISCECQNLDLENAHIKGNLELSGSRFTMTENLADNNVINICRLKCDGNIYLKSNFHSIGGIAARGVEIEGSFDVSEATLDAGEPSKMALHANGMTAKNGLFWKNIIKIQGEINFNGAYFSTISDDLKSWEDFQKTARFSLNGLRYQRISSGSPTDSLSRIIWLKLPLPERHNEELSPHAWEHLIKVLRDMGHRRHANEVAIEYQHEKRRRKVIGNRVPRKYFFLPWHNWWKFLYNFRKSLDIIWSFVYNSITRFAHRVYGLITGFGYKPSRLLSVFVLVTLLCALLFELSSERGVIAPTSSEIISHRALHFDVKSTRLDFSACGVQNEVPASRYWTKCSGLPSEYTTFNSFVYSLDLILPLVDLQQDSQWAPIATFTDRAGISHDSLIGQLTRVLVWMEILTGWALSLMLVAIITRLVNRDV